MEFYDRTQKWSDASTQKLLSQQGPWVRQFVTLQKEDDVPLTSIAEPEINETHLINALLRSVLELEDAKHSDSVIAGGWVLYDKDQELDVELGIRGVWEVGGKLALPKKDDRENIREEVRQHFIDIGLPMALRLF